MMSSKIEMKHISKRFGNTIALDDVSVSFESGKVNAIIGKNGSGKSTLIKILAGAIHRDSGDVLLDGESVNIASPTDAFDHGIVTVYQETSLVPFLSVAENIYLNRQPKKHGLIDSAETNRMARAVLDNICPEIDVNRRVADLTVWQMQVVEIAKAMSFDPQILILDEPTSALAQNETENLFKVIRKLKAQNVAILYISHRLQELPVIADTITVLRDGKLIGSAEMSQIDNAKMVEMMFGEIAGKLSIDTGTVRDEVVLEVRNLTREPYFENVSLQLHKGEILGIAGMLGAGRSELVRSIFGADPNGTGEVILFGQSVKKRTPGKMKKLGLGFIPEDRKREGLVLSLSCRENLVMSSLQKLLRGVLLSSKKEKQAVAKQVDELMIKLGNPNNPASSLSGGNQQKIVVGKWLNASPRVVIFDEPTRGIDIHAKQQIFKIIQDLSEKGIASILISSELEEIVDNCHRIIVLNRGRVVDEYRDGAITAEELYEECMRA